MADIESSPAAVLKGLIHGGEITSFTKEVAGLLHLGNPETSAGLINRRLGSNTPVKNVEQANTILSSFLQWLLDEQRYIDAATLLWRPTLFSGEPHAVKLMWENLFTHNTVMIPGAASMGKTYSLGVWMMLDWLRDPAFTNVQVVGPSEKHLERNLFSHLVKLHRQSSIPLPGTIRELEISLDPKQKDSGIFGVVVPTGRKASVRLQGVKIVLRPRIHPQFGPTSRLRFMLEETEGIPAGVWEDVVNIMANASGVDRFKVACPFNPKDPNSQVALRCEPVDGWPSVDVETSEVWYSKRGWRVVRLDAYKCENVIEGQEIYFGLQTKQGLEKQIREAGGVGTPGYYCVDHETEALTRRGWKRCQEVEVGDSVYSLNPYTGWAEWSPVLEVFRAPYSGELVSIEGRSLSALVTSNHRWPVTDKLRIARGTGYAIKTTDQLTKNNLLPLAARPARYGPDSDTDFAAIVGWLITDGTVQTKNGVRCTLYQSARANGPKCKRIRELLVRQGVRFTDRIDKTGIQHFRLEAAFSRRLLAVVGANKRLPLHFIDSLSCEAREALLEACVLGDGGVQGGSTRYVCSKDQELAGAYVYLAASLGFATTTHVKPPRPTTFSNGRTHPGVEMFYVDIVRHSHVLLKYNRVESREYSGTVWCPRTENGTWYARRHGHVYFTGNTMARGWYPPQGVDLAVIPQHLLNDVYGKFEFVESPKPLAAVDVALEGGDTAILCLGRVGLAAGWRKPGTDGKPGELVKFLDEAQTPVSKECIQVDQLFPLPKGDTLKLVAEVRRVCRGAAVKGDHLGVDRTGNGAGVHDLLVSQFHSGVKGINPSSSPTERKILEEDTKLPCDEYAYLLSELWFGLRKYIEFGFLKIDPVIPQDPLFQEMAGRRFLLTTAKTKVESKKDFKSRGNKSPDRADALTMLVYVARLNQKEIPSVSRGAGGQDERPYEAKIGVTDRREYL